MQIKMFAEMLGNAFGELIGRPVLDFVVETDQQKVRDAMEAMFSARAIDHQIAVTVRHKGGGTIDTLGQGTLTTFQGKRAIVVVILDITERRRSEAKIADLNAQMAATLAALQRHLRDQTEIAQLSDLLQSCATTAEAYPIIGASAEVLFPQASGALAQVQTGMPRTYPRGRLGNRPDDPAGIYRGRLLGIADRSAPRGRGPGRLPPNAATSAGLRLGPTYVCLSRSRARPVDRCTFVSAKEAYRRRLAPDRAIVWRRG